MLDEIPLPAHPESFPIPPPKRFRRSSYTIPPLPSPSLSPIEHLRSFDCWLQETEPFSCSSGFEQELISPVMEQNVWYQDDIFSQPGSYCSSLATSSTSNWDQSPLERQELQIMLDMWNQNENIQTNWNEIQSE